jgi:hypothetical protein
VMRFLQIRKGMVDKCFDMNWGKVFVVTARLDGLLLVLPAVLSSLFPACGRRVPQNATSNVFNPPQEICGLSLISTVRN